MKRRRKMQTISTCLITYLRVHLIQPLMGIIRSDLSKDREAVIMPQSIRSKRALSKIMSTNKCRSKRIYLSIIKSQMAMPYFD